VKYGALKSWCENQLSLPHWARNEKNNEKRNL